MRTIPTLWAQAKLMRLCTLVHGMWGPSAFWQMCELEIIDEVLLELLCLYRVERSEGGLSKAIAKEAVLKGHSNHKPTSAEVISN